MKILWIDICVIQINKIIIIIKIKINRLKELLESKIHQ